MMLNGDNVNTLSAALSTASPTFIGLGLNRGHYGGRRASNLLRHRTVDNLHFPFSLGL